MAQIQPPAASEYAPYYNTYVSKVKGDDLIKALEDSRDAFTAMLLALNNEQPDYRYAPDKWSIKELVLHLLDAERIFTYRALRFARMDKTELAGFDENDYVPASNAAARSMQSLIEECTAVRQSTIVLYKNMTEEMLQQSGKANGNEISVRALGYIIAGHEIHHLGVIKERYLKVV